MLTLATPARRAGWLFALVFAALGCSTASAVPPRALPPAPAPSASAAARVEVAPPRPAPPVDLGPPRNADGSCRAPDAFGLWSWRRLQQVVGLERKVVVMTVDAGLDVEALEEALDLLDELKVRATFFLMTGPLREHPRGEEVVRRMVAAGHEMANHTVSHPHLTRHTDAQVRAQLEDAEAWVRRVAGVSTRPFFREPYLDRDARVDRLVADLCYRSVWFTIYARDDERDITARQIVEAVLLDGDRARRIESGSVLMFHASQRENLRAWPVLFRTLRKRGFSIEPLGAALREASAR